MKKDEIKIADEDRKRRERRFTWTPADIKVLDKNGNWIRGDEFLKRKEAEAAKKNPNNRDAKI